MKKQPWFDTNRQILGEVIPLDTPLAITITPSSVCNFKCNYCMQAFDLKTIRAKGFKIELMPWNTFKKCIDQIQEFPHKPKKIEFYGMGEPLCNPDTIDMIIRAKGLAESTSIMTNGSLLDHQLSNDLIAAGVNEIKISLQGLSSERYKEITGTTVNFEDLISEISYLNSIKGNCKLYIKVIETGVTSQTELEYILSPICDRYSVENILPLFEDVDYRGIDVIKTRFGYTSVTRPICTFPFYRLIILTDGRVTSCCDPLNSIYWGNIHESTLVEMWNSQKRHDLLKLQLRKESHKHSLCWRCYMPNDIYSETDNLEPYAKEALERIK